jgi:hypothetical protein
MIMEINDLRGFDRHTASGAELNHEGQEDHEAGHEIRPRLDSRPLPLATRNFFYLL